jgi:hypothetical protein
MSTHSSWGGLAIWRGGSFFTEFFILGGLLRPAQSAENIPYHVFSSVKTRILV